MATILKRENLEKYIGKYVEITLLNNQKLTGILYKTGTERYKNDPNLYIPKNYYVLENEDDSDDYSFLFRCSYVKKLTESKVEHYISRIEKIFGIYTESIDDDFAKGLVYCDMIREELGLND